MVQMLLSKVNISIRITIFPSNVHFLDKSVTRFYVRVHRTVIKYSENEILFLSTILKYIWVFTYIYIYNFELHVGVLIYIIQVHMNKNSNV